MLLAAPTGHRAVAPTPPRAFTLTTVFAATVALAVITPRLFECPEPWADVLAAAEPAPERRGTTHSRNTSASATGPGRRLLRTRPPYPPAGVHSGVRGGRRCSTMPTPTPAPPAAAPRRRSTPARRTRAEETRCPQCHSRHRSGRADRSARSGRGSSGFVDRICRQRAFGKWV